MTEEQRPEEQPEDEPIEELGTASLDELLQEEQEAKEESGSAYVSYPWPARPLSPATPALEPPLFTPPKRVRVRIEHDGYAVVDGERRYVSLSNAGAWVNVEKHG